MSLIIALILLIGIGLLRMSDKGAAIRTDKRRKDLQEREQHFLCFYCDGGLSNRLIYEMNHRCYQRKYEQELREAMRQMCCLDADSIEDFTRVKFEYDLDIFLANRGRVCSNAAMEGYAAEKCARDRRIQYEVMFYLQRKLGTLDDDMILLVFVGGGGRLLGYVWKGSPAYIAATELKRNVFVLETMRMVPIQSYAFSE